MNLDLSQFFGAFFEEAEELLVDMERLLLNLDVANPSSDDLNAIFRCAHSIKGGAATFGFTHMTELTHVAESILDRARTGTLQLRENMVDAFLETKDVLKSQLDAYRQEHPIDTATLEYMVAKLNSLTAEDGAPVAAAPAVAAPVAAAPEPVAAPQPAPVVVEAPAAEVVGDIEGGLDIKLINVSNEDCELIVTELKHLGTVLRHARTGRNSDIVLQSTCTADDIIAVSCFIIDADQIVITPHVGGAAPAAEAAAPVVAAPTPAAAQTEVHARLRTKLRRPRPLPLPPSRCRSARPRPTKSRPWLPKRRSAWAWKRSINSSTWWANSSSRRPCWRKPRRPSTRCSTSACLPACRNSRAMHATCKRPPCPFA